jgi:hypothetical protein
MYCVLIFMFSDSRREEKRLLNWTLGYSNRLYLHYSIGKSYVNVIFVYSCRYQYFNFDTMSMENNIGLLILICFNKLIDCIVNISWSILLEHVSADLTYVWPNSWSTLFRFREVPVSNLGPETIYPYLGISWLSSVPSAKFRDGNHDRFLPIRHSLITLWFDVIYS